MRQAWLGGALFAPALAKNDVRAQTLAMAADYDGAHWLGMASTTFEVAEHEPRLGDRRARGPRDGGPGAGV